MRGGRRTYPIDYALKGTTEIGGTWFVTPADYDVLGLFADDNIGGQVIFDLTRDEAREVAAALVAAADADVEQVVVPFARH